MWTQKEQDGLSRLNPFSQVYVLNLLSSYIGPTAHTGLNPFSQVYVLNKKRKAKELQKRRVLIPLVRSMF